jgi:hypothetical protein
MRWFFYWVKLPYHYKATVAMAPFKLTNTIKQCTAKSMTSLRVKRNKLSAVEESLSICRKLNQSIDFAEQQNLTRFLRFVPLSIDLGWKDYYY